MALRFAAGILPRREKLAEDLYGDLSQGDHFLLSDVTIEYLRKEVLIPGSVIDRTPGETADRGKGILDRAHEQAQCILAKHNPQPLSKERRHAMVEIMKRDARCHGLDKLPPYPEP